MEKFICEICDKTFERYAYQRKSKHIFCSRKCYGVYKSKITKGKCPKNISQIAGWNKGKDVWWKGDKHWNWKGGRKVVNGGYILLYKPDHKFSNKAGFIFEHRLVMEKKLRKLLKPTEVVHHINSIKDDNRPENLELFKNNSEHFIKYHKPKPRASRKLL